MTMITHTALVRTIGDGDDGDHYNFFIMNCIIMILNHNIDFAKSGIFVSGFKS